MVQVCYHSSLILTWTTSHLHLLIYISLHWCLFIYRCYCFFFISSVWISAHPIRAYVPQVFCNFVFLPIHSHYPVTRQCRPYDIGGCDSRITADLRILGCDAMSCRVPSDMVSHPRRLPIVKFLTTQLCLCSVTSPQHYQTVWAAVQSRHSNNCIMYLSLF